MRTVAVVGASGNVGAGITRTAVARGWQVVAIARSASALEVLHDELGAAVRVMIGSVADDAAATSLAACLGPVDDVVVSVSAPIPVQPLAEWSTADMVTLFAANVGAHHAAHRHLLSLVRAGGTFLGIGGGTADFVLPRLTPISVVQSAQRMLYRGLAKEVSKQNLDVRVLELLISAMVDGDGTRDIAQPDWITDGEIGSAVCDLLEGDDQGPILTLRSPRAASDEERR